MKKSKNVYVIILLAVLGHQAAFAQFTSELNLSDLNGQNGLIIIGENGIDFFSGYSVSSAGDVNGDDVDDLIIGAFGADLDGLEGAGKSYVVFGSEGRLPNPINLSNLNGQNGFMINGENRDDASGISVSSAGDVNGDDVDDLIIGALRGNPNGQTNAGKSYVVFGSADGFSSPFNLFLLNGQNGFIIDGESAGDFSGHSVSSAGDVNNDGFDDLIIGAFGANTGGQPFAGKSYVVYGSGNSFPNPLNLSTLNSENGFAINGEFAGDESGRSVSSAGDINGDGVGDFVIGAHPADLGGDVNVGKSYVVFGRNGGLTDPFNLLQLNGRNGFVINGENAGDNSGISVNSAGDINGDGIDDLIIGASGADPNGQSNAGKSYVFFGIEDEEGELVFPNPLNLIDINGQNGFVIYGENAGDESGISVSSAGDVNDDGIDDLIIGASKANPNGAFGAGKSYVVFGNSTCFPSPLYLSTLNGNHGFTINGENEGDESGISVSSAGDFDNDGIDDLIIGASRADLKGAFGAGKSYVVFGGKSDMVFADGFDCN